MCIKEGCNREGVLRAVVIQVDTGGRIRRREGKVCISCFMGRDVVMVGREGLIGVGEAEVEMLAEFYRRRENFSPLN